MTVLCQVEACLNSRPLLPVSSHSEDGIEVLTPGHFLIGQPLRALPEANVTDVQHTLRQWMLVQNITQHWWHHWSAEYLQQLQHLHKWQTPKRNISLSRTKAASTFKRPIAKLALILPQEAGKDQSSFGGRCVQAHSTSIPTQTSKKQERQEKELF